MSDPFLSSRDGQQNMESDANPFASPTHSTLQLPARPLPILQKPYRLGSDSTVTTNLSQESGSEYIYYDQNRINEKSGSMSSGEKSVLSPFQSVELAAKRSSRGSEPRKHSRPSRDFEKGYRGSRDHIRRVSASSVAQMEDEEVEAVRELQESHALRILLFLSFPCVVLSFLNLMWTIISIIITMLSQPVRLCARRLSFGQQLGGLLGPSLNLQLKSIYTPLPPHANEDSSYHTLMLITVQMLSPIFSLGVMVAAWVVAIFWISSLVVGDPTGTDRRDDGTETVLALRGVWEKWLYRSIREQ